MNKRRKLSKLTVSRETLRHLQPGETARVAGATGLTCVGTCAITCPDSCLEYNTCPQICTCQNTSIG